MFLPHHPVFLRVYRNLSWLLKKAKMRGLKSNRNYVVGLFWDTAETWRCGDVWLRGKRACFLCIAKKRIISTE